jgi:hypothetical protein
LAPKGLALRNLEIVSQLQVVGKVESVSYSHVSKALEEVHLGLLVTEIPVFAKAECLPPRHFLVAMHLQ